MDALVPTSLQQARQERAQLRCQWWLAGGRGRGHRVFMGGIDTVGAVREDVGAES